MSNPVLIAEFCQNHNGDFGVLEQMIESAVENGATYGKIQAIFSSNLSFRPQFEEDLSLGGERLCIKRPYRPEYGRLKELELTFGEIAKFVELCRAASLKSMITIFAREHIAEIGEMGFDAVKVASYDCASFQFLRELKNLFPTIFLSTGATFDEEIVYAVGVLSGVDLSLLHCVTIYPTPIEEMHLARMKFLRKFTNKVGFSDHSLVSRDGLIGSKAALALGADIVERHFTVLESGLTKDGPVSIGPAQLRELSDFSKLTINDRLAYMDQHHSGWRTMIGKTSRMLSDEELLNRGYYRGRFGSSRTGLSEGRSMIDNWEEVPLK
jgi:N,N'-diacetyllegionaminate synthase